MIEDAMDAAIAMRALAETARELTECYKNTSSFTYLEEARAVVEELSELRRTFFTESRGEDGDDEEAADV